MFEDSYFRRKKADTSKLTDFGFAQTDVGFTYSAPILDGQFNMTVSVSADGNVSSHVYDCVSGEEYTLYKTDAASGSFVGAVRKAAGEILAEIAETCFIPDIFKSDQTHEVLEYIKKTYGDEPEFLWEKFDDNAVCRRKDTKKWYAAILTVAKNKLGLKSEETAEIIDLRIMPDKMADTLDGKKYFPGWHMNKKSWYTIILDNSVDTGELCRRIDESYRLAVK